jgi:hypothetical protein
LKFTTNTRVALVSGVVVTFALLSLATVVATSGTSNQQSGEKFTPWSTEFEEDDLVQAALNEADAFFGKVSPNDEYELIFEPSVSDTTRLWMSEMLSFVNGAFMDTKVQDVKAFVGTSHEWGKESLESRELWVGQPGSPYPCSDGTGDVFCVDKNIILIVSDRSDESLKSGFSSVMAHEYFHIVQYSLTGPQFTVHGGPMTDLSSKRVPRWLVEGSANFFGFYVSEKLNFSKYRYEREFEVTEESYINNQLQPLEQYDFVKDPDLNPYGIGQVATEYLIASSGFESLLNIFRYTNSEGNFDAGFKKATGIELSDFYARFELVKKFTGIGD